jgi:hypothetical protein
MSNLVIVAEIMKKLDVNASECLSSIFDEELLCVEKV